MDKETYKIRLQTEQGPVFFWYDKSQRDYDWTKFENQALVLNNPIDAEKYLELAKMSVTDPKNVENIDIISSLQGNYIKASRTYHPESVTSDMIRAKMRRLVEYTLMNVDEGANVIVLSYGDFDDEWDGYDDSTEPEDLNWTNYYLSWRAFGDKQATGKDLNEILDNVADWANAGQDLADYLTEDRNEALLLDTRDLPSYSIRDDFCQELADIYNAKRVMDRQDWVANVK